MDNKIILESLTMDLKRAALGFHRGSYKMGQKFLDEAIKRKNEYVNKDLKPYMVRILKQIDNLKIQPDEEVSEKALMYSTLIQNYILKQS